MDLETAMRAHAEGRLADAESAYRRLLEAGDTRPAVLHWLGMVLYQAARPDEALPLLRRSVEASADSPEFNANLGGVLNAMGHSHEALPYSRRAVELAPGSARAHYNLAAVLESTGKYEEALLQHDAAIELEPNYAHAHTGRGNILRKLGKPDEAVASHRKAIELRPDYPDAYRNLAAILSELGDLAGTLACYQTLVKLRPDSPADHSALIVTKHYSERYSPEELSNEAKRWGARHADHRAPSAGALPVSPRANGKIRVGYVSDDFCDHPVARLVEPVLAHHDRRRFEVYCYSGVLRPDELTQRLRRSADVWRDISGLADEHVAEQIRSDRVTILVDLTGHFARNRLLVFARRPAAIQISHFGYFGTTGMTAMDWRLTDTASDPPGLTERLHTERLFRLPETSWCYCPMERTPESNDLPALSNGFVTFCCLNNPIKITDHILRAWAEILRGTPKSRLLLLSKFPGNSYTLGRLESHGIPAEQVLFTPPVKRFEYLSLYHRADIALDTFPFNGDNTTCDAMWMGIPVVTLQGNTFWSRRGVSHLCAVGLKSLIVDSADSYAQIATQLASELPRLASIRATLRRRMLRSPLTDAVGFTRNSLERAYASFVCSDH